MADDATKIVITASDQTGQGLQSAVKNLNSLRNESEALAGKLQTNLSGNVRNISYQLQDMAVQIGGETSAMRALSQQLPQMLMGFGAFGAVVGVAAAIIPTLVTSFTAASGGAQTLAKTTDELNKAIGDVGATTKTFDLDGLYKEYNNASVAARQATIEQLKFQQAIIESARVANEGKFGETTQGLGDYSTLEKLKGLGGASGADKLAKDLGLSVDAAREFLPVLKGLRDGSTDVGLAFTQFGNVLLTGNDRAVKLATGLAGIAKSQRDAHAASSALTAALQKMGDGTEQVAVKTAKAAHAVDWWLRGMGDIADALKAEDAASKKAADERERQYEQYRKLIEADAKVVAGIEQTTAGYEKQAEALMLTQQQLLGKERARVQEILTDKLATTGIDETTAALERQIEAIDKLAGAQSANESTKAAQRAAEEWDRAASSIQSSLTDALLRGFEDGKNWAQNFIQTLKNMFGSLVLRPIIQGIVAPVAGGITGMLPGAANASSGIGNLLGGGSSLLGYGGVGGLFSGAGGIFGAGAIGNSFALSGMGQALGLSAAGLDMAGGVALTTLGTTLGAAIPVIGAALAIASLAGAFDSKGGPKGGGFASAGAIGTLSGADNGRWFTPNSADSSMSAAVTASLQSFDQLIASLGGSGTAGFALGYDSDPQGTAPNRLHAGAFVGGRQVYDAALGDLGRDDAALQSALALEAKRSLLAALQASELPQQIAAVFDSVVAAGASSEAIDNLFAYGAAMKSVIDSIGGSVVTDAQTAWERSQRTAVQVLGDMGAEVIRLAANMDGSASSMQALASATGDYRAAVVQTLVAIKQISAEVESMFGATRTDLENFGKTPQQLYESYLADAAEAEASIQTATDPATVRQLSQRINNDISAAFNALGDDARGSNRDPLLNYLNGVDAMVQSRLTTLGASISSSTTEPFAAANAALDGAATKFAGASDSIAGASDRFAAAVDKFAAALPLPVRVQIDMPQAAEVGG